MLFIQNIRRQLPHTAVIKWWTAWYGTKRNLLWYGIRFLGILSALYSASLFPFYQRTVTHAAEIYAELAHGLIQWLGGNSGIAGSTLSAGPDAIITVGPLCTGFDYSWFLMAAVSAFPAPPVKKLIGVLAGVLVLVGLNFIRIVSLYWVGVRFPGNFAFMHEQLWALLLNFFSVCLMIGWMTWVTQYKQNES